MKRINVVSNSIRSIGFDKEARHLEVEFHNGRRYRYEKFPHRLYQRFMNASSIGNFFHAEIRPSFKGIELPADTESRAKDEESEAG